MIQFFQKIIAFFVAIGTFISGLFGLNSNPCDLGVEPSYDPAIEIFTYDIPVPEKEATGIYSSSGGTEIGRYDGAVREDFESYVSALTEAGYTLYDENEIDENLFASFYDDDTAIFVSWFSRTGTLRVIAEPKGELPPLNDTEDGEYDTLLTGIKGETTVAAEGMGFVVRLADGSFVIIDGGMGDPDHVDSDKLMNILLAQKPADADKPVIAGWIFTHLHGDHVGVFNCFSIDHHDDVIIERLYFNFPKEEEIAISDSPYMLDDTIYRYTQFKRNLAEFYPDVPVVKPHSGNRFAVRNAEFEVLYAYDDLYPQTILNGGMNENSLLLKMTVEDQTILWTGDFAFNATDLVLSEYDAALKSDILQMAHHGYNGTEALYAAVYPTIAILPVSFDPKLDEVFARSQNAWLLNSQNVQQFIITNHGTWTVQLPYKPVPGTFERVPSADVVYPAYPELLG